MTSSNKDSASVSCPINSNISKMNAALKRMPIENKIPESAIAAMKSLAESNKKYLRNH
ncbi:hypothetical protein [Sulfurimonas microaerophilic]|uniref:hypothetical protein n=1 Tax=Sulfurimonas microaerophilic TaxID=3058392 RepID=UPI002714F874|nr:hypothetical protein [Sulfurimonas sp. hsl 1-7]